MTATTAPRLTSAQFHTRDKRFVRDPRIPSLGAAVGSTVRNGLPLWRQAQAKAALLRARAEEAERFAAWLDEQAAAYEAFAFEQRAQEAETEDATEAQDAADETEPETP